MVLDLVNKPDIWKVKKIHSNLLAEQDETLLKKSSLNEETDFGLLVALTTKLKVIAHSLEIFTYFKNNNLMIKTDEDREKLFMITKQLVKRINIHLYQIRKINPSDYEPNSAYYSTYIKIIYNYIIFGKINAL
jgi:hypothetical protein